MLHVRNSGKGTLKIYDTPNDLQHYQLLLESGFTLKRAFCVCVCVCVCGRRVGASSV